MFLNLTHSSFLRAIKQNSERFDSFQSASLKKFSTARRMGALFTSALILLLAGLPASAFASRTKTAVPSQLTSPVSGSVLSGSTVTFEWTAGTDVQAYCLHLNTQPGTPDDPTATRIFDTGTDSNLAYTVSSIPMNGATLYAILGSEINGSWSYVTYTFTEAGQQQPVAKPILSVSPSSLSFGNAAVNTASTQTITLSSTGSASVTVSAGAISGSGFTVSGAAFPLTLGPNQTATLAVQFDPTAAGAASGSLTLASNSSTGSSTVVGLSGTGTPVLAGLTCANASMTGAGTDNCTVTLNAAAASGGFAVSLASNNSAVTVPAAVTVAAGSSTASFTATVKATTASATATLTASAAGASQSFAVQLGAGVATLTVNTTSIAFGDVDVASPASQSVTMTSSGSSAVTVNSAAISGTGFSVSGATFPLTLSPNQSATLTVEFDPTTAGAATGQLTISSNSSANPSDAIALTGTGESTSYEVTVAWDAPSSSPQTITGYNVYRSPSGANTYAQINPTTLTETSYTDTNVQAGLTYDYMVESVDAAGAASSPSNMAAASIP
jgi:Abnormal spindle-like microcephaly-assoc'd, ASPM-SPD-2-Hydin/Fibronectin type III domain